MRKATRPILIILLSALFLCGCAGRRILTDKKEPSEMISRCEKKFASPDWERRVEATSNLAACITTPQNLSVFRLREEFRINMKVEELLIEATHDPHPQVRIEAARIAGALMTQTILGRIKVMAVRDKNSNVRWHALKTLALFRDPDSLDIFLVSFKSRDWIIREASIAGLLSLDSSVITHKTVPVIIRAINDPSTSVSITALNMVKIRDKRIYRTISGKLTENIHSQVTLLSAVLTALEGYRLDSKTREKVINLLVHENSRVRILALRVLKMEKILLKDDENTADMTY